MTSAIIEILLLLIVSCLIGIFFTYRYWKSKYKALEEDFEKAKIDIKKSQDEAQTSKSEADALRSKLEEKNKELEEKNKELEKASNKPPSKAPKVDKSKELELEQEIELLNEQLGEKEREIEELSGELAKKKISYYKQIDGKRYKAITIKMADESVAGKGDGRISKEDAEKIFSTISDGKSYTQVEKDTMRYLRENYNWTEGADELFRHKVRSWAAKGHELDKA